jgi:tetratricopeptide (TPR) repeat protein
VDAPADVFALGCVLFECLTGRPAFTGPNAVAVLARVLRDEPPRPSDLCPELGQTFDGLIAKMLAKDPRDRFRDAQAVLVAIDALITDGALVSGTARSYRGLSTAERRFVGVIIGCGATALGGQGTGLATSDLNGIRQVAGQFGTEPVAFRGNAFMIVLSAPGAATDHAAQVVRCALLLHRRLPQLTLAVATGRAENTGRIPIGAAIDSAAQLLMAADKPGNGIPIDDLTAALLDSRFSLQRTGASFAVTEELAEHEATRLLLGRPTRFVGRDKELGLLELTLRECISDSVARALLVTGPPGQGKSRLRHEFVARVHANSHARVLSARADPLGAGSSFLLVRQLLRHAIGRHEADAAALQFSALRAHLGELRVVDAVSTCEFLAELIDAPSPDTPSPELRAARNDPQLMSVSMRNAFGAWIAALCAHGPLVITLEDLHWGDVASTAYLDQALHKLFDKPLLLVAFARPDVVEVLPNLWSGAELQRLTLGRLTARAAESLAREVLGADADGATIADLVQRADGNPLYLEELIRHVAADGGGTLPGTVLALLQSRLERQKPMERHVIRAASIFGETCWQGGIAAVLGSNISPLQLDATLRSLEQAELLAANTESRFPGQIEYCFRHGLVREAAYAMLTDADRTTGHALAGEWLEDAGERDALRMADHLEMGGEPERAVPWLVKAAQDAVDGGNAPRGRELAQRAIACGPSADARGRLVLLHAQTMSICGDWHAAARTAIEAMTLLRVGSTEWFRGAALVLIAAAFLGDPSLGSVVVEEILRTDVQPEPSGAYGFAICFTVQGLAQLGCGEDAEAVLTRASAPALDTSVADPIFVAWIKNASAFLAMSRGDLGPALDNDAGALAQHASAGMAWIMAESYSLLALCQTGEVERTAQVARSLLAFCEPLGLHTVTDWTQLFCAWSQLSAGLTSDVVTSLRPLLDRSDPFLVLNARAVLVLGALASGDEATAVREAALLREIAPTAPNLAVSLPSRAWVELHTGDAALALELAEGALSAAQSWNFPILAGRARLTRAEALARLGRADEALAAIDDACANVRQTAQRLRMPGLREAFLRAELNARAIQLARDWRSHDR